MGMTVGEQRALSAFEIMEKTARAVSDFENFEVMVPGKEYEISFRMRNSMNGNLEVADFLVKEVPGGAKAEGELGPDDLRTVRLAGG